jgi:pectate lyase
VTNLNDSGAGSLRDAISAGNRCVVFDVGGTISLASMLGIRGGNVTVDGFSAPSPGITLRNHEIMMHVDWGSNNVIVRGIRSRDSVIPDTTGMIPDGITIVGVSNIVIDHVSVAGFGDGAIDVTDNAHDITIQWSIFAEGNPAHNLASLIKYDTTRISVHHNLYVNTWDRNPMCAGSDIATAIGPEVVADVRNNLIWNYSLWGTTVRQYGTANVVNNYYYSSTQTSNPANALMLLEGSVAYASGNYSQNGLNVDSQGNRSSPFAAIAPTTTDAITAAHQIVAQAGARNTGFGLDTIDLGYVLTISPVRVP